MKKLFSILLACVMILGLAACGGGNSGDSAPADSGNSAPAGTSDVASDPAVTLVYAEVNPLDTIVGKTASEFKRLVEEKSGGSITIDVRDSGVLGSENDVLDAIVGGDD